MYTIIRASAHTAEEALEILEAELRQLPTFIKYVGSPSAIRQEEKTESEKYLAFQAIE